MTNLFRGEGLARELQLCPADVNEESVLTLVKRAINSNSSQLNLQRIYHVISRHHAAYLLEPLEVVPLLLPVRDQAAKDMLALVGQHGNAKEVILATQEAVERLEFNLEGTTDDPDDSSTLQSQLACLIHLYVSSLPRLTIRRKKPSEVLHLHLPELESTITLIGGQATQAEGRQIITLVSRLVQDVTVWVKVGVDINDDELLKCKNILQRLIECSLTVCSTSINSSLAQRTFEDCFPHLTIHSTIRPGQEEGENLVSSFMDAFDAIGFTYNDALSQPTVGSLIYLAHAPYPALSPHKVLSSLLPIILTSIQTSTALDESLSILLKSLVHAKNEFPKQELAVDIIVPLFTILPYLASTHPDSKVRQQVFRIISLILSLAPSPLRFQILFDLTSDLDVPQMCVAAIGLLKEATLQALSQDNQSIFASSLFLQTFGPILFRPRPIDFFSLPLDSLRDSQEPARLVECLSLYYVLLLRDKHNRTGIRDPGTMANVEKSLLAPLRLSVAEWMNDASVVDCHLEGIIPLASLQISLERVDGVLKTGPGT